MIDFILDVDDTLLKTTLTLDTFSDNVREGVHPLNGRWSDIDSVMWYYDNTPMLIDVYSGVVSLLKSLEGKNVVVCSAARVSPYGRCNRLRSLQHLNVSIKFFETDHAKIEYINTIASESTTILDDKLSVLNAIKVGRKVLANPDVNGSDAISIEDFVRGMNEQA